MASSDVIDLVGNDDEPDLSSINSLSEKDKSRFTPSSLILRNIGLSVVKVQYGNQTAMGPLKLNKNQLWTNFWLDTPFYNFKYLTDFKFHKTSKCPVNRATNCNNSSKMSRLDYIHHVQKGHLRNKKKWRDIIRRKSNILEITCVLCPRGTKEFSVRDYASHMRKRHPSYPLLTDYYAFFKHCFICNTQTNSLPENVAHREVCSKALFLTPHNEQTTAFNSCFEELSKISNDHYYRSSVKYSHDDFYERIKKAFESRCLYGFCLSYNPKLKVEQNFFVNGNHNRVPALNYPSCSNNVRPRLSLISTTNKNRLQVSSSMAQMSSTVACTPTSTTPATTSRTVPNNGSSTKEKKPLSFADIKHRFCQGIISTQPQLNYSQVKLYSERPVKDTIIVPYYGGFDKNSGLKEFSFTVVHCELCNSMTKGNINLYNHIRVTHPAARFFDNECKSCQKKFYTPEGFLNHFAKPSDTCPAVRKCAYCNVLIIANNIYKHILDKHKSEFEKVLDFKTCLICKLSCDDPIELRAHVALWHGFIDILTETSNIVMNTQTDLFHCHRCSSSFTNQIELRNHMIIANHYFTCKYLNCQYVTDKAYFLQQHITNEHCSKAPENSSTDNTKQYSCELCPSIFPNSALKISHFISKHSMKCFVPLHYIE